MADASRHRAIRARRAAAWPASAHTRSYCDVLPYPDAHALGSGCVACRTQSGGAAKLAEMHSICQHAPAPIATAAPLSLLPSSGTRCGAHRSPAYTAKLRLAQVHRPDRPVIQTDVARRLGRIADARPVPCRSGQHDEVAGRGRAATAYHPPMCTSRCRGGARSAGSASPSRAPSTRLAHADPARTAPMSSRRPARPPGSTPPLRGPAPLHHTAVRSSRKRCAGPRAGPWRARCGRRCGCSSCHHHR